MNAGPVRAPVRWGLLGAGHISQKAIAPAIHAAEGARLEAVAARNRERAEALEPAAYAADDYRRVIEDPEIDAVYIALDNAGHEPWAIAALEAGKPVLCEKPLGLDAAAARRMREAEAATGGLLVEATWNLWHPRTQRAMHLLAAGHLGAVTAVSGTFTFEGVAPGNYRLDPARGGGAMLDVGCYPLAAAAWATSAAELTLQGARIDRSDLGVDLAAECDYVFGSEGGVVSVVAAIARPDAQVLRVTGSAGSVEFPAQDAFTNYRSESRLVLDAVGGSRVEEFAPVDPYQVMVEHVSLAVRGEPAWLPDRSWSLWVADAIDLALSRAGT
jgi:D-xylose 1-dehydrogenase (NADP+, D-xylono-1,5-lactone-forming)